MNRPSIIPFIETPSEATFAPVFEEQRNLVYRICLKLLRSPEDAEEAFQATWARLLFVARNPAHRPVTNAEDLVARLAVLEADALRKRRNRRAQREVAMDNLPEDATPATQSDVVYTRELAEALELSVGELPETLRDAATLHYLSGLSQRQVAAALKLPEGTVATRLRTAKQRLAEALRRRGIVNADGTLAGAIAAAALIVAPAALRADTCFSAATAAQAGLAAEYASVAPGGLATLSAGVKLAGIAAVAVVLFIIAAYTLRDPEPQPIPPASVASMDVADAPAVRDPEPALPVADTAADDAPQVTPSPTPDSATPPVFTVRGVIRDTAGQPIRDAEVVLELISVEEVTAFNLVTLTTTRSRANGSYEAATSTTGLYVISVWKEGYSRVREHLVELDPVTETLAEQGTEAVRDLVLPAESQLTALVRTEDGSPVAGARVYILQSSPGDSEAAMPVRHEGQTDDEGRFHVRGAARAEGRVIVIAAGHPRGYALIGPTDHEVTITVSDEYYPLIGRVMKSDGTTPLEGVRVQAMATEEADWNGFAPREETWTDAAGSFAFSSLPATDHSLGVHLRGHKLTGVQNAVYIPLLSLMDEEYDLTLTMEDAENRQYMVVDQGTGEPLEGVKVALSATMAQLLSVEAVEAVTGADGVFTGDFPPLSASPGMLTIEKEGYVPLEMTQQKEGEPFRFFMMRSVEVSGKVVRVSGDSVSGAQLYVSYRRPESESSYRGLHQMGAGESGSDGTFQISVPHDAEFTLLVREGNRELGRWGPATMTEPPADPVVITITDPVIAEAIVVDESDQPIADAKVTMTTFLRDQGMGYTSTQYVGSVVLRTDPFGRFRTEVASLDNVSFKVEAEGYAIVESQMLSSTEINRIVMQSAGELRGRVVDEHGNGLAGFRVNAYDATHQNNRNTTSGADGRFVIDGIVAGTRSINISVNKDNMRGRAENLSPGQDEHIIRVQTEGLLTLLGSVVDKNTGELLTISGISTTTGQSRVREKGFFSVDGLPRGSAILQRSGDRTLARRISARSVTRSVRSFTAGLSARCWMFSPAWEGGLRGGTSWCLIPCRSRFPTRAATIARR